MPTWRLAPGPYSSAVSIGKHCDRVDLDQIIGRGHLTDLDHGGSGRRRLEVFAPHIVDLLEMLHVAHVNVDPADVVHAAARLLDRRLEILADLARLRLDVADPGNGAVGAPRGHAGDEDQPPARLDHRGMREMAARLADFRRTDLLLGHAFHSWSTYLRSIRTAAHLARSFPRKRESRFLIWVPACAGTSGSEAKHRVATGSSARVLLVAVEVRFEWVMRTVIDFEHNCLFVRERRPVHL